MDDRWNALKRAVLCDVWEPDFVGLAHHAEQHKVSEHVGFLAGDRVHGDLSALRRLWGFNRFRIDRMLEHVSVITERLDSAGVAYVLLKGFGGMLDLWPDRGCRRTADIDILIDQADVEQLLAALPEFVGRPLSRAERVEYALNPDHVPHLVLRRSGVPPFDEVMVDPALSVVWARCGVSVPVDRVLGLRSVGDKRLLFREITLLHSVLHTFRDGYFHRQPVLRQWAELARGFEALSKDERERFARIAGEWGVWPSVVWVLGGIDELFGRDYSDMLPAGWADDSWVKMCLASDGSTVRRTSSIDEWFLGRSEWLPATHEWCRWAVSV